MKRRLFAASGAAVFLLAACATPEPRVVRISEAELNAGIARQIPPGIRSMGLFDVRMEAPVLTLLPQQNRLRMEVECALGAAPLGNQRVSGRLQFSAGLRVEPSDGTVRFADVRVERTDLQGLPPNARPLADVVAPEIARRILRELVVHRLRPEDMERAARYGYRPGAIRIVPGAIEMTIEPV